MSSKSKLMIRIIAKGQEEKSLSMEYKVYPDRVKEVLSLIIYAAMAAAVGCVIVFSRPHWLIIILCLIFLFFFAAMAVHCGKKALANDLLYIFNEQGITDLTRKERVINLDWNEVAKIEMLTNNSSLQIGIVGARVFEDNEQISINVRENLLRNGNTIFYNIIIDGFLYRKKQFNEIFNQLRQMASRYNAQIVINEYIDPLARKKKSRK